MISDPHETKYLKIADVDVPVWIYGNPEKPLIYFIHGYFRGFSDYIGDLPMRYLMKDYCIIAMDLPGFGYLKELKMDRKLFLSEVIENTSGKKEYILFGGSYGGLLSLEFAEKYPKKVKGIIIGGMPYFGGLKKLVKLSYLLPFLKQYKISKIVKEFNFLGKENLSKFKMPVLLLYSTGDKHATLSMGRSIDKMLPNSKLFTIKGLNHAWLMHRIDESGFLDEIKKFINDLK